MPCCQLGIWGKEMAGSLDETNVCIDNNNNLIFIRHKIEFKYMIFCALGLIAITLNFVGELTYNIICLAWQNRWHFAMPPVVSQWRCKMSVFSGYYFALHVRNEFQVSFFPSEPCLCPWNISLNSCYNESDLVWVGGGRDGGGGGGGGGPGGGSTKKRKPPKGK